MAGNAWEWTADWYHEGYRGAPVDGSAWVEPPGSLRTHRGGSWHHISTRARTWDRGNDPPCRRDPGLGLRPVRDLPQAASDGGTQAICRPGFSLEKIADDDALWKELPPAFSTDHGLAEVYFSCLAYLRGSAVCAGLSRVDAAAGDDRQAPSYHALTDCQKGLFYARMARAVLAKDRPLGEVCREIRAEQPALYDRAYGLMLCEGMAGHPGDAAGACSASEAKFDRLKARGKTFDPAACRSYVEQFSGEGECRRHDGMEYAVCRNIAAFKSAFAAKDPALCAGFPLCGAMMGQDADVCRRFARDIQRDHCSGAAAPAPPR